MSQLSFYKWVLKMHPTGIKMLVDMYNAGMLAHKYAVMLEVIDGLPDDD